MKFEFSEKRTKDHYKNPNEILCSFAALAKKGENSNQIIKTPTTKMTEDQQSSFVNSIT